jgi:hypothetical protein
MTLEEVGKLLRLSSFELDSIMRELPVFELAGKIRVRRQRLFEWIESREKANAQASIQSAVEKSLQRQSKANVA